MDTRKLASLKTISKIVPIEGADKIECAYVGQWPVVVKKGDYQVGDSAVYFEIDSLLPKKPWNEFLFKGKENKDKVRLKSIRLRGQLSQGLLVKPEAVGVTNANIGDDLTDVLGIEKWEPVIPAQLGGDVDGAFPTHLLPKTDEERYQNLNRDFYEPFLENGFVVTIKMDGTSCTVVKTEDEFMVCGRNWRFKPDNQNTYCTTVHGLELSEKMAPNTAIQAELCGPGIQGNKSKEQVPKLYMFNFWDLTTGEKYNADDMCATANQLGIDTVPIIDNPDDTFNNMIVQLIEGDDTLIQEWLGKNTYPNTKNLIEGIVVRTKDYKHSFKIISNQFLLKGGN